jgi:glycogen phosphorylase
MRLLVDVHLMAWDTAWDITRKTFAYTNHTLLPEALEKWPLPLFESVLPRHLEIIYAINSRFMDDMRLRYPFDQDRIARLSLIDESGPRYVRMANLACVGSHAINGVAELHYAPAGRYRAEGFLRRSGRRNSRTRPMASRRAASSCCPTPACPIC